MNSLVALMIVTSVGVTEAPNNFASLKECQAVSSKLKVESYCVEKKPVDIEKQMSLMIGIMAKMKSEMEKEFK
jgi:hypothetical protein